MPAEIQREEVLISGGRKTEVRSRKHLPQSSQEGLCFGVIYAFCSPPDWEVFLSLYPQCSSHCLIQQKGFNKCLLNRIGEWINEQTNNEFKKK